MRCARCKALREADARFCAQCGASFAGDVESAEERRRPDNRDRHVPSAIERRQITFVFCDLVGSTALSAELDPEDYKDILVAYRQTFSRAMLEFDGRVERHIGDGTLVYFGYPEAHEDDAERAIHAALKATDAIGALELPGKRRLQVRIGIATGMVVVADLMDFAEHDAMGDAPNIAARLQSHAGPNEIIVESATRRLAGDLFEFHDEGLLQIKGIKDRVQAWRVMGAKPVGSRFEARGDRADVPMLGRDEELRTVVSLWQERARQGAGQIVLVSGDAGIGKSRLAAVLIEEARREPCSIFQYYCAPYRQGSPLHPFIQQLEHAGGFLPSDAVEAKVGKLDAILAGASEDDRALVAELLNLPVADRAAAPLTAQVKRRRMMQALVSMLERATRRTPVLLVFEDAQWSDDSSRELLTLVTSRIARMPMLLLVLARPAPLGDWAARGDITRIPLSPLTPERSAALVHHVAGDRTLDAKVVQDIVARTDGIPFFLEEVTQAMVEGPLGPAPAVAGRAESTLSMLLRASLLPRLNRLGRAREILEVAAAIGREFSSDLVAHVVAPEHVTPLLDRLVASGLVLRSSASDSSHTFKHALIRDAAYEMMGRDQRRGLHSRIAASLEAHFPDAVANHPEILAWHYTEARGVEKAVPYWLQAGRQALRRSAMGEALNHLRRGLELLADTEDSPWRLQNELAFTISIGMAQIATQGYAVESTGKTFAAARALCERLGDPPPLLACLHGLWTHALLRGEFASARRQAEYILARGEERADPLWRLMGQRFSGVTHHPLGQFGEAISHLERGLALYDPSQRATYAAMTVDDPRVVMLTYLSWSLMCTGKVSEAIERSREAVAYAKQTAHVYTLAHALNGAAFVALTVESPQAGLERLDELAAVLADNGIAYYEAVETIFRGWGLSALGDHVAALPLLRSGISAYRATGSVLYLSACLRMSAESHARAGRFEDALPMIEEASAIMRATNQRWDEAEIHRVHGTVLEGLGDAAGAEKAFRRALAVAAKQGAKLWEQRARDCIYPARSPSRVV